MIKSFIKRHFLALVMIVILTPLIFLSLYNILTKEQNHFSYFVTGEIDEAKLNESFNKTGTILPTKITCLSYHDQNYADLLQTSGLLDADILIIPLAEVENYKTHLANSFAQLDPIFQDLDGEYQLLQEDGHIYGLIITSSSIWQNDAEDPCLLVINLHTMHYETAIHVAKQLLIDHLIQ